MEDIRGIIENEKRLQEMQKQTFEHRLRKLPQGKLVMKNGYYYKRDYNANGREEFYIPGSKQLLIDQLKERGYLEKSIRQIETNLLAMERLLEKYQNYDPLSVLPKLGKAYQMLPEECYALCGISSPENFENENQERNFYLQEHLKMITIKGHKVRSKSELDIANQLFLNQITYRYEPQILIGGKVFYPDFEILKVPEQKIFYWEHLGMMGQPEYREHAEYKLEEYRKAGIVPWKNLIITYDDENGGLDSKTISKIIDVFLKS